MAKTRFRTIIEHALGLGYFPHYLSFLIHNPLRRLLITPEGLTERMPLNPDSHVLEVGPGSGYFSVEIARRVPSGHLELLDIQLKMLVKARRHLQAAGVNNVGYTEGNATALPFLDSEFDVALLVAVLGEVADQAACLQSLHRVLRPSGTVVFHEHLPDPDFLPLGKLRGIVEAQGFVFVERRGWSWNYTASFRSSAPGL